jgi:hypothetical protein
MVSDPVLRPSPQSSGQFGQQGSFDSWSAAGMTWSAVPITAQDGIDSRAGPPDSSNSALVASGCWVAASTAPWLAGRPLAKHPGNTPCLT